MAFNEANRLAMKPVKSLAKRMSNSVGSVGPIRAVNGVAAFHKLRNRGNAHG